MPPNTRFKTPPKIPAFLKEVILYGAHLVSVLGGLGFVVTQSIELYKFYQLGNNSPRITSNCQKHFCFFCFKKNRGPCCDVAGYHYYYEKPSKTPFNYLHFNADSFASQFNNLMVGMECGSWWFHTSTSHSEPWSVHVLHRFESFICSDMTGKVVTGKWSVVNLKAFIPNGKRIFLWRAFWVWFLALSVWSDQSE